MFADEVVDIIPIGDFPQLLAYNPDNGNMYVANTGSNTVSVIDGDTNTVIETIDVRGRPIWVAYNSDNGDIYMTDIFSGSVFVITVTPIPPPTADAGTDQTVASGSLVQLDGSGSSDSSNLPLTYQWTQTAGPSVTLDDDISVNPTFTAPKVQAQEVIVFE